MGSKAKKVIKWANPLWGVQFMLAEKAADKVGEKIKDLTGETAAKRAAALQRENILRQQQQEKLKLAESEDEIKRRKYLAKVGGRRSLIASGGVTKGSLIAPGGVTKGSTDRLGG